MKKLIFYYCLLFVVSVYAQQQDTSNYEELRYKIKNEDFFLKYHPTAIHYFQRANCKMQLKMYDEAIEDYTKTIELDSKNSSAYNSRGKARARLKNYKDALGDFEMAVRLSPDDQSYKDNLKLTQTALSLKN